MKRIITYISILAAALTAGVSCSRDLSFDENQDGGKLTLVFRTEQMGTRVTVNDADPVKGVGAENAIEHVDYFFFADDDPTSEAVVSGRLTVDQLTKVSDTEYKYDGFDTSLNAYKALQGPTYLYVLANYPETVNATTMEDILALPISTDFKEEQTSFVMDTYDSAEESVLLYLTPKASDGTTPREVEVPLARAAAKIVLNFDVKNSYEDAAGNVWTPVTDQMWVNFLYARKNTTVAAEAVEFDEKANYYNTDQETPASVTAVDADHTSWKASPVYTYPQGYETSDVTAPYFKIFCPWTCEKKGLNNFYYKIILPDLGSFQRNKIYTVNVEVSVIGGTEDDWALVSDYIYVADWWAPEAIVASFEGGMYLDVPVKHFDIYGVDDVYIPVRSSNDIDVTVVSGRKVDLLASSTSTTPVYTNVTPSVSEKTKEGFKLSHHLDDRMSINNQRNPDFDCTPIEYELKVKHTTGGLSKEITVTVTQYPPIYAKADASNGYAYVNSYAYTSNHGGRYSSQMAYNSRGNSANGSDQLGQMNQVGSQQSGNNNRNQYVVSVSVLPEGYKVAGMDEPVVIGDPRGGSLRYNYLGYYGNGANGTITRDVQSKYSAAATSTQNVIAPALRIASSWGATTYIKDINRAEERCAAYQENGYPAGRWRLPTVAEIDFLIRLSTYEHIPALFTTQRLNRYNGGYFYTGYWSNGPSVYLGKPFTDAGNTAPYLDGAGTSVNDYDNQGNQSLVLINGTYVRGHVRCVYDEWFWSDQKYGSNGQPSNTAATQWIGYIF